MNQIDRASLDRVFSCVRVRGKTHQRKSRRHQAEAAGGLHCVWNSKNLRKSTDDAWIARSSRALARDAQLAIVNQAEFSISDAFFVSSPRRVQFVNKQKKKVNHTSFVRWNVKTFGRVALFARLRMLVFRLPGEPASSSRYNLRRLYRIFWSATKGTRQLVEIWSAKVWITLWRWRGKWKVLVWIREWG